MAEKPTIVCKPDGPYVVTGLAQLVNSRGEPIEAKATMSLCRCGGSANKPFCDGTHWSVKFADETN
jgi:CDGSH-type Zn-finger protein